METISVIVPVYNVKDYLERCVQSIIAQTYKKLEIILVDDGSTDGSGEMCDNLMKYDERIRVVHQENKGLSGARNTGIGYATGRYIGFVDSDDWIAEEFYEKLYTVIQKSCCDVVSCEYVKVHKDERDKGKYKPFKIYKMNRMECQRWFMKNAISGHNIGIPCWIKLYKKELFDDIRFPQGRIYEDVVTNWEIINKVRKYVHIDYVGYFYFKRNNSITKSKFNNNKLDLIYNSEAMEAIYNEYDGTDNDIKRLIVQFQDKAYFSVLYALLRDGHYDSKLIEKMIVEVRERFGRLFMSALSLNRKLFLVLLYIIPKRTLVRYALKETEN